MNNNKKIATFILLIISWCNYSQLGFCTGTKGDALFSEKFGNGTTYGPALPANVTNYNYTASNPNDGWYTLFYTTLSSTWHNSLDHTPDATDGINGKALIVNANANTSGDFYKRTVTGLCVNTTFEFSAWLLNVYNPNSGACNGTGIPINVRFEIWNATETVLLRAGNTGNIAATFSPLWQQFALVFTTTNQTSVVLKMKNNGIGGCGNDLAIDDIEFKSCTPQTILSSPSAIGNSFTTCAGATSLQLQATTTGSTNYSYHWQTSTNGTTWTDIIGANTALYTATNLTSQTFFRTKVAQDVANLSSNFCTTVSNIFTVSFFALPANATSNGNAIICGNQTIPSLSVAAVTGMGVNWYDAPIGGNLLQSNSTIYAPTSSGTFYAEVYNLSTNCKSLTRTAVSLTIVPSPTASITATSICSGSSTSVIFNGTPNAIINFTVDGGTTQTISLNNAGTATLITPILNSNSTYRLVSVTSSVSTSCVTSLTSQVIINVIPIPVVAISGASTICSGSSTIVTFTGTPNAIVTYKINGSTNQNITLNNAGIATLNTGNLSTDTSYTLVNIALPNVPSCAQSFMQTFTITLSPSPTASITATSTSICSGSSTSVIFNGTPNAIINFTVDGGTNQTISLNNAGTATLITPILNSNSTYSLVSVTSSVSTFCVTSLTSQVNSTTTITINQLPIASYSGTVNYCSSKPLNIDLISNVSGTTFSWTVVQNGVSGATSGTGNTINQILSTNAVGGNAVYSITPTNNGCIGSPIQISVIIHALPKPILTDGVICLNSGSAPSSQFYTLSTGLNSIDYSFKWFLNNVVIPSATTNFYNANQVGNYSVIATNILTSCNSDTVFASVTESIKGENLIINQTSFFSNQPTITVNVVGGNGPFLYQIDDSEFQFSNVFSQVSAGTHIINVVDKTSCTKLTTSTTIITYPHFFTPNGDGFHDYWNIDGLSSSTKILIYDRFGKLLKQIFSDSTGWDGTYEGQIQFADDYWFVINYIENGVDKIFKAHFTLKR